MALGRAEASVQTGKNWACFERAKEGFVRLLEENSAEAVGAASRLVRGTVDERIAEYRQLWEIAKVSVTDETVAYDISNNLGEELMKKGGHEEAKVFYLAALEGRRRVLGEEHKKTLSSLCGLGDFLLDTGDYTGALDINKHLGGRGGSWGRHFLTP